MKQALKMTEIARRTPIRRKKREKLDTSRFSQIIFVGSSASDIYGSSPKKLY
jgi:uncharacterized protein (DUF2384 family)